MRAEILPLDGRKYYGTEVRIGNSVIKIWDCERIGKPSEREIAKCDPEDLEDPYYLSEIMVGGHYEDAGDLAIAKQIVEALNKLPAAK